MGQIGFGFLKDYKKEFGGALLNGKRKSRRPLSTKDFIHVVLKSDARFFSPTNQGLQKLIRNTAAKFGIKIKDLAPNWTHIHLLIKINHRNDYVKFIRALSSLLAQAVMKKTGIDKKLFTLRPFTRIVRWGRDLRNALNYIQLNQMEAWGLINRKEEKKDPTKSKKRSQNLNQKIAKCHNSKGSRGISWNQNLSTI